MCIPISFKNDTKNDEQNKAFKVCQGCKKKRKLPGALPVSKHDPYRGYLDLCAFGVTARRVRKV